MYEFPTIDTVVIKSLCSVKHIPKDQFGITRLRLMTKAIIIRKNCFMGEAVDLALSFQKAPHNSSSLRVTVNQSTARYFAVFRIKKRSPDEEVYSVQYSIKPADCFAVRHSQEPNEEFPNIPSALVIDETNKINGFAKAIKVYFNEILP